MSSKKSHVHQESCFDGDGALVTSHLDNLAARESLLVCSMDCEVCQHMNLAFQTILEYHAVARVRYEAAVPGSAEARALERELADSSEPIRRAAKELREHERTHSREAAKTRHRLLRLVKSAHPKYGTSFLLDHVEDE